MTATRALVSWSTAALLSLPACERRSEPVFAFATVFVDGGRRPEWESLAVEFPFTNGTLALVQIRDVVPGCSCSELRATVGGTVVDFSSRETARPIDVAAGASGCISARVLLRGLVGERTFSVRCFLGSDIGEPVLLRWRVVVEPHMVIEPNPVLLRDVPWSKRAEFVARVSPRAASIEITGTESLPAGWGVEYESKAGQVWIRGWCDPWIARPNMMATLVLLANGPSPRIAIPLSVEPTPVLAVEPGRLITLSQALLDCGGDVEVRIQALDGRAVTCRGIDVLDANVPAGHVTWSYPSDASERLTLCAHVLSSVPGKPVRSRYRIRLDHPFESEVDIRLLGIPRSARRAK